jgi:DNA-binding response OmpR family regulator
MTIVLKMVMVEDVPSDAEMTLRELQRSGMEFVVRRVETEADLRRECIDFEPDIVVSDFALPQFDGLSALRVVRELRPDLPFIFLSGTIGEETAIESLRSGANDYVLKTNLPRLPTVRRALHDADQRIKRLRPGRFCVCATERSRQA